MKKVLIIVVLLILALVGYKILQPKNSIRESTTTIATDNSTGNLTDSAFTSADFDDISPTYVDSGSEPDSISVAVAPVNPVVNSVINTQPAAPSFSCDGRKHCSQMTSCAEATYFLKNCPNTKMDGNNDGIPCEQQWCQ